MEAVEEDRGGPEASTAVDHGVAVPLEAGVLEAVEMVPARGTVLRRVAHALGLDRAIVFSVMARGWSSLAGLGTLTLIARFLTPAEQGFYYSFYSLVALQIIFELGFSVVILQGASHEAAHLTIREDGTVEGPAREHGRLASVLKKAVRWYSVAAVLMGLVLAPAGVKFLRHAQHKAVVTGLEGVHFVWPWLLVVAASSLTFQLDPIFSFLEGCGYVPEVARTRLRQSMLSTCLGWSAFLVHRGLYAPGLFILGQGIAGAWFVVSKRKLLMPLLRRTVAAVDAIDWKHELWPFQWRIAVSWLSGYLTSQIFVPTLMDARGPVEAGRMGMSLTVCATLTTMCLAWINTKAAPFGKMIARKEYARLDRTFLRTVAQSAGAATVGAAVIWLAVWWLGARGVRVHGTLLANRLLPPLPLAMLLIGTLTNVVVCAEALYVRAHKEEKFMVNSIAGALYGVPVALVIGRMHGAHGGAWGIALAYAIGGVVIGLGFGTYTWQKWRRIWHAA